MINGTITHAALRSAFRFRGSFVGPLTFLAVMFSVEGSFWATLGSHGGVGSYSARQIILYSFLALIVSQVVACVGEPDSLPEKIESGQLDQFLVRPQHYLSQMMGVQLGTCLARMLVFVPIAAICALVLQRPVPWRAHIALALLLPLAAVMNFLINQVLYTLTFYYRDSYAFVGVKETLFWVLSGTLIPLDLFPQASRQLLFAFPPAYVAYLPVKVALGDLSFTFVLAGQVLFTAVLLLIAGLAWRVGVRHYQAYGG